MRKAVLTVHVISSVSWIGVDLTLLGLIAAAFWAEDGDIAAASVQAVVVVIPTILPVLAALMLVTGLLLGLGTKWGVLKYKWLAAKAGIGGILATLVGARLVYNALDLDLGSPGASADQVRAAVDLGTLLTPPLASGVALTVAVILSVYKPRARLHLIEQDDSPGPDFADPRLERTMRKLRQNATPRDTLVRAVAVYVPPGRSRSEVALSGPRIRHELGMR